MIDLQGLAVAGARVTVKGTALVATTAANGQYRLDNVPAGWQTVQAVKAGMVAGAMVAVARPPVDREARGFAVNGEPPAGRGLAGLPDRANRTARSLLARPAETGQAVAETRVFVTPDETVTAPDLLLAPEGAANNDSVALVRLSPAPSTARPLQPGSSVTITAEVRYLLHTAADGLIKLFLLDEEGYDLIDPAETAEARIAQGEGNVTLRQTLVVPRGIEEAQLLVVLFAGTNTSSSIYAFGSPYPVTPIKIAIEGLRNGLAHPTRHEIYAVGSQLYVIDCDNLNYLPTGLQANPGSMLLSSDGETLYLSGFGEVMLFDTTSRQVRRFPVEEKDVFAVAPVTSRVVAYFYREPGSDPVYAPVYAGLLDIETGEFRPGGETFGEVISVNSDPGIGSLYIAIPSKPLERWIYNGSTLQRAETGRLEIRRGERVLCDPINHFVYITGAKADGRNINWIYADVTDYWSTLPIFIALSPNGRWVADQTTVYETTFLTPYMKYRKTGYMTGGWVTFGADGLLWVYDGTYLQARPLRGGEF